LGTVFGHRAKRLRSVWLGRADRLCCRGFGRNIHNSIHSFCVSKKYRRQASVARVEEVWRLNDSYLTGDKLEDNLDFSLREA
jgi:hypothetical protein